MIEYIQEKYLQGEQKPLMYQPITPKEEQVFRYVKNGSLDKVMSCAVCGMCG
ncbi:MAG: hypothetical protein KKE20_06425 [Nanoarchaeota archaeon]|nr:hypothetical protein [Nanoarchaeota archaeon]